MGQTRAQKLEAVALEGMSEEHKLVLQPMIRAMAKMIAEATKSKERRATDPESSVDYVRGEKAWRVLSVAIGVAWEPVQAVTLKALGRAVKQLNLSDADLWAVRDYIWTGGLAWMSETPTTSYVVRNLADLVAKARHRAKQETSALDRVRDR